MVKQYRYFYIVVIFAVLALVGNVTLYAQTKRGITPEDYYSFAVISDPHLSPDGTSIAYVLTTVNEKSNCRESSVWVVESSGSTPPKKVSPERYSSTYPRWSPDGSSLAMLTASALPASQKPKRQIYIASMVATVEGRPLTMMKNGVKSYEWSPDGSRIVVVSTSGPNDAVEPADRKSDVRHYTHMIYKFSDTGWDDGQRQHLWVVRVNDGVSQQITAGNDWNDTDPQWSPDGTRLSFVSDRTGKAYDDIRNNTDVWVVPATGGPLTKISDHAFADDNPRWSPDGKRILFTGKTAYHQFPKLYVADSSGSTPSKLVVKNLDLIPTELKWSGPETVMFQARVRGEGHIFRSDLVAPTPFRITSGLRSVHDFDINDTSKTMVYLSNDPQHLDDLYIANLDGTGERKLTDLNSRLWSLLQLQPAEEFTFRSTDGWPVAGYLIKPLRWTVGKKYPLVLVIHGGPRDMFGFEWNQEMQNYAANGWAVFFCNPRGSVGYGESFERGEINNWGVMDYEDIMAGVDATLKRYPWIDSKRLGVTGGSYGGYMTNWIISHTDRFRAAVTLRSLSNFVSDEGTRWQPYGHTEYFKENLFNDFDQYWEASPIKHARNVHTPTLILHSDNDFQLPIEQGEQWFRALQHYGVPSELVLFPRENHDLTRTGEPKHLVESFNWQLYWFRRYLDGDANAKAPDVQ